MNKFRTKIMQTVRDALAAAGGAVPRLWLLVVVLLFAAGGVAVQVMAQEADDDPWSAPVNLSNSGASTAPLIVTDKTGRYHLLWEDNFDGFGYLTGDGRNWEAPVTTRLPFTQPSFALPLEEDFNTFYRPALAADSNGRMHAFWINNEGLLLYRRVLIEDFTDINGWTAEARLSGSASAVAALVDAADRLHLVYIRPQPAADIVAGVYHRVSEDGGSTWEEPVLLTESPYLQVVEPAQLNLQLVADETDGLHLVWDNPALEKVYYARSDDGGVAWSEPLVVDQREPDDDPQAARPAQIRVGVRDSEVHLTWQAAVGSEDCGQYHQWSDDGGSTWPAAPEVVIDESGICPGDGHLLFGEDGLVFLLTTIRETVNLQAWDQVGWSEPAAQSSLQGFINPQNNRAVALGCLQPMVLPDASLTVFGCGQGPTPDVWQLTRPLGVLDDWSARFRPTPVWQEPVEVVSRPDPFATIEMVYAGDGQVHAFWAQADAEDGIFDGSNTPSAIYYSRLRAGTWTPPRPVLESPIGKTDQPAAAADDQGNLFVVWSGGESGQIYFSRAVAERAISVSEWAVPLPLPSVRATGGWPDVMVDNQNGVISVVYSIPLNEERGIYLTQSEDEGETWSSPVQVFDGVAAGWEMVGQPQLTLTRSGTFHLLWSQRSQPGGVGPLSLVYARSDDMGQTWSSPEVVSNEPAVWSQIIGQGNRMLHRAWLVDDGGRVELFHQYSEDDGQTWQQPDSVFDPNVQPGPTAMVVGVDTVFLLQLSRRLTDDVQLLQQWQWEEDSWRQMDVLTLGSLLDANTVSAVAAPDGNLSVLYGYVAVDVENNRLLGRLRHTNRDWAVPLVTATPLPPLTPTPVPDPTETPVPTPAPTATIELVTTAVEEPSPLSGFNPLIVSVGLAALLVIVVFVFGLRATRSQ